MVEENGSGCGDVSGTLIQELHGKIQRASNGFGDIRMEGLGVWTQIGRFKPACWEKVVGFVGMAPSSEQGHLYHDLQL